MIEPSTATLRRLARTFLDTAELHAWEPTHHRQARAALEQFADGRVSAPAVRASIGDGRTSIFRARKLVAAAALTGAPAARRSSPSLALLSLTGVLTAGESIFSWLGVGTALRGFTQQLVAAAADPAVHAIVIVCDSPGGSVRLVPETASLLHAMRTRKPIVVSVAGLCASAAYWICANATRLEATPSADIGAIGVVCQRVDIHRRLEQEGIDITTISAGKFKSEGMPETKMSDAERQHLQARVDKVYGQFVGAVARGRGVQPAAVRTGYGEGRCVTAPEAERAGMIDGLATVEDTIVRALAAPQTRPRPLTSPRAALTAGKLSDMPDSFDRQPVPPARPFELARIAAHRRALAAAARRS